MLRTTNLIILHLALVWIFASCGKQVRFAQITDAHLFDTEKKANDNRQENERGLRWAIDEINRRNTIWSPYDFVVFTGDVGLEGPIKKCVEMGNGQTDDQLKAAIDTEMVTAARQFASFVRLSEVKRWLMVPGNNDLFKEDPETIANWHKFITMLRDEVEPNKFTVMDFVPSAKSPEEGSVQIDNCLFVGFDNSSFKSNNNPRDRKAFQTAQTERVDDISRAIAISRAPFVYIFCHVPDVDDPFLARKTEAGLAIELRQQVEKSSIDEKEKTGPTKMEDGDLRRSSWTVDKVAVWTPWERILRQDSVKAVFAGHFHSQYPRDYIGVQWSRGPNSIAEPCRKLLIAPPIAVKNQIGYDRARGFRDVTVDGASGAVVSDIVWLESPAASKTVVSCRASLMSVVARAVILVMGLGGMLLFVAVRVRRKRSMHINRTSVALIVTAALLVLGSSYCLLWTCCPSE